MNNTDILEGKFYHVEWRYNKKNFSDYMQFMHFQFGKYYFLDKSGDWLMVAKKEIISIKP